MILKIHYTDRKGGMKMIHHLGKAKKYMSQQITLVITTFEFLTKEAEIMMTITVETDQNFDIIRTNQNVIHIQYIKL